MTPDNPKALLVILDGWGIAEDPKRSAIDQARTPIMDELKAKHPYSKLVTYGEEVGLPTGQMGNSEVGHLNIGAGRIVYQDLAKINKEIETDELKNNPVLQEAILYAKKNNKNFHILGLVSDGGVHSHIDHLYAVIDILEKENVNNTFIHAFLDGRDTNPNGGKTYLTELLNKIENKRVQLASIIGRYFAMDRDQRWERIQLAYDLLVQGKGEGSCNILESIQSNYDEGITDEFMPAIVNEDAAVAIQEGDVVFFINYRTDRPRQLTQVLTQSDYPDYGMSKLNLHYCTMTEYSDKYIGLNVLYAKDNLKNTIGEVVADAGFSQLRIAETEKYPHVSFFFSGGREKPFHQEGRIMIPSPKVATYDLQPEMSAAEVTAAVVNHIEKKSPNFICLNYANTDMVGHTGVMEAAIKACETVDEQLGILISTAQKNNYDIIVIADHGNSDIMINEDGSPHTAHTTNPVPCIYIGRNDSPFTKLKNGKLADIAPTILSLMGVDIPEQMTGNILVD